ncbi:MAG: hypothetical protein PVG39_11385 [Desulfobacteraceae bacterium]|jgi:hypothetical protein
MRKYLANLFVLISGVITAIKKVNFTGGVAIGGSDLTPSIGELNQLKDNLFTRDGTTSVEDTGNTTAEYPLDITTPNLDTPGVLNLRFGKNLGVSYNNGRIRFYYVGSGNQQNEVRFGLNLGDALRINGYDNAAFGGNPAGSGSYRLRIVGTSEITDTLALSKATGVGLAVTADISFNAIDGGATKAEINSRCDGVPNYSTDDNPSPVTVTSGGVQAATLDLGTVTAGDVFFIEVQFTYSKGATGGKSNYYINQASGAATIAFPTTAIATSHNDAASITYNRHFGGMCFVTGSGTLVMQMGAFSDGSDSSIGSGACDLAATFIKKQ